MGTNARPGTFATASMPTFMVNGPFAAGNCWSDKLFKFYSFILNCWGIKVVGISCLVVTMLCVTSKLVVPCNTNIDHSHTPLSKVPLSSLFIATDSLYYLVYY